MFYGIAARIVSMEISSVKDFGMREDAAERFRAVKQLNAATFEGMFVALVFALAKRRSCHRWNCR
jgi:hypothetical protein